MPAYTQSPIRGRIAAVALCVVLFAMVAYWASLDAEERRPRERGRRPVRATPPATPEIVACEMLVGGQRSYRVNLAECPRPSGRRVTRLVPFRPTRHPFERN